MIRRDDLRDDRGDWLIIPQVEHARLAGELACVWGNEGVGSVKSFSTLLGAIEHHDDGWRKWDEAPRLNPATGFPRSFLEMQMRDSTAIWTRSIAICSADPLAGIAVSRHFCYLAELARNSGRADSDDRESIDRFLDEQSAVQIGLANEARSDKPAALTSEDSEKTYDLGFRAVRFFDRVSLWLCCGEQHQAQQLVAPMGEVVTLIPNDPTHIAMEPYPLHVDSLRLTTPARRLAARRYANDDDLQTAFRAAPIEVLAWTIGRR